MSEPFEELLARMADYDQHCSDDDVDRLLAEIARLKARVAELEAERPRVLTDEDVQAIVGAIIRVYDERDDRAEEVPEIRTCDCAECECMAIPSHWTMTWEEP